MPDETRGGLSLRQRVELGLARGLTCEEMTDEEREARAVRMGMEDQVMSELFPDFVFSSPLSGTKAVGRVEASGHSFGITIAVPDDYPRLPPRVYVSDPVPRSSQGRPLDGPSHRTHTLGRGPLGLELCLFNTWVDTPIYQVVFRAQLWLTAYVRHLETGEDIATYL